MESTLGSLLTGVSAAESVGRGLHVCLRPTASAPVQTPIAGVTRESEMTSEPMVVLDTGLVSTFMDVEYTYIRSSELRCDQSMMTMM